uniref:Uncharacterized protein n=1 Tax=Spongospora subterranea TaxID=70186 RepID=A0A0H5R073_9EUKA|eukprot:CRZ07322.1 hypothetical protein [Spongospora subterranea]
MLIFLLLLAATAVSCENHTINVNDPLNEFVFTNVFPNLHADQRQSNFAALTQAMSMLDLSFASYTQVAAFLGTVAFNTDDLNRHEARCAQDNSCDLALYDTTCNPGNSSINGNHFYPRSAMMISFQCGYAHVDSILRNYSALAGIPSLTENPYLLSTNLLFSYLASLAVWADPDSNGESCMSLTATNMTGLPSCISKMNPWECSLAGQQDQARHLQSISKAAQALGINMALDDLTPISCSNVSVVNSPAPTALPEDDCTGPWADDNSSLPIVLPGNSSTACGIISQQMFAAAFSQLSNDSNTVDIHFQSLSSACEFASIDRLDVRQASFLLGSMMLNMMNVSDAGNASDTYYGRGLMMIFGFASYQRLSIYLRQLGINYDVVSDPDIVSSNCIDSIFNPHWHTVIHKIISFYPPHHSVPKMNPAPAPNSNGIIFNSRDLIFHRSRKDGSVHYRCLHYRASKLRPTSCRGTAETSAAGVTVQPVQRLSH